jgi:predicted nuclease of predicted toxin-antitoxin system
MIVCGVADQSLRERLLRDADLTLMAVLLQRKPSVTQYNSKNINNRQIFTKFIFQKKENSKNLAEPRHQEM